MTSPDRATSPKELDAVIFAIVGGMERFVELQQNRIGQHLMNETFVFYACNSENNKNNVVIIPKWSKIEEKAFKK